MTDKLIELRVWRQFVTLAEELHFSRAAQRLHMTQPPLTQSIAQLERTLSVRLFDRTKRSVQLTAAGQTVLPLARDLLARAAAMPEQATAVARGEAGLLRLAFVSTAGFELLPAWVRAFGVHSPRVRLELIEATGDMQQQALERDEIDAGFMLHAPGFVPAGLGHLRITQEPLVLALPERHALASVPRLRLRDVLGEPLVMFPRRILPSIHDALFGLYHGAGRSPRVVQDAIQMQTIVNLVSAGLGVAWVPRSVTGFQRSGVVYRPVDDVAGTRQRPPAAALRIPICETSLVWQAGSAGGLRNPALGRFLEFAAMQLGAADAAARS